MRAPHPKVSVLPAGAVFGADGDFVVGAMRAKKDSAKAADIPAHVGSRFEADHATSRQVAATATVTVPAYA
jgi:hypothetical protein